MLKLHRLTGCTPTPLASYLKALGILRLVAQQADPEARGMWREDVFHLVTSLDQAELLTFFAERYAPTPIVTPWNGGSGFYPKDKAARSKGVDPLAASTHPRFALYRAVITSVFEETASLDEKPGGEAKTSLQALLRSRWSGGALEWFDAAIVLGPESPAYPALLGTGGNDGRLDFSSNFMQRLVEMFDLHDGTPLVGAGALRACLFAEPFRARSKNVIGQFDPHGAGGANATSGFSADSTVNPWDFVLMLEGAVCFRVAAVRHLDASGLPQAAAPFAFRGQATGFASAARSEESSRGEQWMPLWSRPATLAELTGMLREGRAQVGRERARGARDAARAISTHAVSRGIDAFERYGYLERQGQSNLAVPLGRWTVRDEASAQRLNELDTWLDALRRASKDPQRDPQSLRRQVRRLEDSVMALYRRGGNAGDWQRLLRLIGQTELALARRPRHTASHGYLRPLHGLSPQWVELAGGSPEVRLAAALASLRDVAAAPGARRAYTGIRDHVLPLTSAGRRFATQGERLASGPDQVWQGRDLVRDLVHLVSRRLLRARSNSSANLGFDERSQAARIEDVQAFVRGSVDDAAISEMAVGLMAVDWSRTRRDGAAVAEFDVDPALSILHLGLHLHSALEVDPIEMRDVVRLLNTGAVERGFGTLIRRARARGVRPLMRHVVAHPERARRLAASLAFPLHRQTVNHLRRISTHHQSKPQESP